MLLGLSIINGIVKSGFCLELVVNVVDMVIVIIYN